MGISRDPSETDCYQPLTSVHFDQKRKPEGKMKVLYINLYVVMVMVAYALANPVKTRSSSGADQVQEKENLVPVKREDALVKARDLEQFLGPVPRSPPTKAEIEAAKKRKEDA